MAMTPFRALAVLDRSIAPMSFTKDQSQFELVLNPNLHSDSGIRYVPYRVELT